MRSYFFLRGGGGGPPPPPPPHTHTQRERVLLLSPGVGKGERIPVERTGASRLAMVRLPSG
eukprot:COSAG03_NODE_28235_length_211_cov_313.848214_1_plen_60_part_01